MPERSECEAVARQLWPYLDGALPAGEFDRVVRHLEMCSGCRSAFDYAHAFLDAVASAPATPSPALTGLESRVLAALAADGFTRES